MMSSEEQIHEVGTERSQARGGAKLTSTKQIHRPANPIHLGGTQGRDTRTTPATLRMLTPLAAWHHLCAKTGGTISLVSFYRWIRNGRVCAVRLGRRCYVPIQILDDLIKRCLEGEEF